LDQTVKPIILFDLDGTLIDSTEAILESFAAAFEHLCLPMPDEASITAMIGVPLDAMFARLGVAQDRIDEAVRAYKACYRQISCAKTVLLPGAREAVELAATFARLGVVTSKTGRYSRDLLEHLGLMHHFETLVGSEDVTHHKPDPEAVHLALARMQSSSGNRIQIWMIGDTPMDVEAARRAGIAHCAVTCGYASSKTLEKVADCIVLDALEAVRRIAMEKSSL
jgi:phosphoglycolate phosphatase